MKSKKMFEWISRLRFAPLEMTMGVLLDTQYEIRYVIDEIQAIVSVTKG